MLLVSAAWQAALNGNCRYKERWLAPASLKYVPQVTTSLRNCWPMSGRFELPKQIRCPCRAALIRAKILQFMDSYAYNRARTADIMPPVDRALRGSVLIGWALATWETIWGRIRIRNHKGSEAALWLTQFCLRVYIGSQVPSQVFSFVHQHQSSSFHF